MDENNPSAAMTSRCLTLPEIIYEVASYLDNPQDLLSASSCSHIWYETLIPLRMESPCVHLRNTASFRDFLSSNEGAVYHCQALRICSEAEDDEDEDSDEEKDDDNITDEQKEQPGNAVDLSAIMSILHLLSTNGRLKFFTYALPGQTSIPLPEDVWIALRKLSSSLQGMYVELSSNNWHTFLTSLYSNLQYLRLSLAQEPPKPASLSWASS
ncbi:hypothetical protein DFH11DRAFT_904050 [Phellopilus nigrolimitatus]|nr:hypothetical protein DFH11DRAFT_904050 [Phellopilus nigrolimitatus]